MKLTGAIEDHHDTIPQTTYGESLGVAVVYGLLILVAAPLNFYIARALHQLPQQVKRSVNDYLGIYWSATCALYSVSFLPVRVIRIIYSNIIFQNFSGQHGDMVNEMKHTNNTGNQQEVLYSTQNGTSQHKSSGILIEVLCWSNFVGENILMGLFLSLLIVTPIIRGLYVITPIFMFNINVQKCARRLLAGAIILSAIILVQAIFNHKWVDICMQTSPHSPTGEDRATFAHFVGYTVLFSLMCGLNFGIYSGIFMYLKCCQRNSYNVNTQRSKNQYREPVHAIPLIVNIINSVRYLVIGVLCLILYFKDSGASQWVQNNLPSLLSALVFLVLTPCVTLFAAQRIRHRFLIDVAPLTSLFTPSTTGLNINGSEIHTKELRVFRIKTSTEPNNTPLYEEDKV